MNSTGIALPEIAHWHMLYHDFCEQVPGFYGVGETRHICFERYPTDATGLYRLHMTISHLWDLASGSIILRHLPCRAGCSYAGNEILSQLRSTLVVFTRASPQSYVGPLVVFSGAIPVEYALPFRTGKRGELAHLRHSVGNLC